MNRETCQSAPRDCNQQISRFTKLYSSHKPDFSLKKKQTCKQRTDTHGSDKTINKCKEDITMEVRIVRGRRRL